MCFRDLVYEELKGKARDAVIVLIEQEREGEQIDRGLLKNVLDIFVGIGMGYMEYYENDFEDAMLKHTAAYYSRKVLLRDDKVEDLSRMYRLFHRINKGLEPVSIMFKQHVVAEGMVLVQQVEDTTNSKSETPFFVRKLIELYDKYMAYVTNCFANNSLFHKALKEAFEVFCNKIVAGCSSAELLASYCDNILKKGGSEKLSDDAIEETLDKVVKLLAYINDKDLFAEFCRKKLSRRLLFDKSANDEHGRLILTKLKQQCGGQFTSKMEGMLTDLTLAKENQNNFQEYLTNNPSTSPGIDFSVTVLTSGFWPSYKSCDLSLPVEMAKRESEGFERRRREEEEKKGRRREEEEIKQGDHRGFSSGVIPFKLLELLKLLVVVVVEIIVGIVVDCDVEILDDLGLVSVRKFRVGNVKEKVGQLARSTSASRTCSLCEQKSSPRRGQDADSTTQVPRINIQYAVDPVEHSRVSVSAELRKPGQGFAWGQQWSPSAGPAQGVGSGRDKFDSKTIELILGTYQAAVLLLFNSSDRLSYSEIKSQLNLADDDLIRLLQSLSCAKYKILIKEPSNTAVSSSDHFEFNSKFTDRMRRIRVPLPPVDERKKVVEDVGKDRRYAIDAS
ncbi:hypothetical protein KY290_038196 [Solanum tuberosum]|uniref:Cullin family profile domain-containing protein n=1 Tax=Solanum tuberosum TaxID=4113 RepID=A0ABQ7TY68_SOLTU|nr:hypothetical protein KY290_038196 [Solanum tuberosum]